MDYLDILTKYGLNSKAWELYSKKKPGKYPIDNTLLCKCQSDAISELWREKRDQLIKLQDIICIEKNQNSNDFHDKCSFGLETIKCMSCSYYNKFLKKLSDERDELKKSALESQEASRYIGFKD